MVFAEIGRWALALRIDWGSRLMHSIIMIWILIVGIVAL